MNRTPTARRPGTAPVENGLSAERCQRPPKKPSFSTPMANRSSQRPRRQRLAPTGGTVRMERSRRRRHPSSARATAERIRTRGRSLASPSLKSVTRPRAGTALAKLKQWPPSLPPARSTRRGERSWRLDRRERTTIRRQPSAQRRRKLHHQGTASRLAQQVLAPARRPARPMSHRRRAQNPNPTPVASAPPAKRVRPKGPAPRAMPSTPKPPPPPVPGLRSTVLFISNGATSSPMRPGGVPSSAGRRRRSFSAAPMRIRRGGDGCSGGRTCS